MYWACERWCPRPWVCERSCGVVSRAIGVVLGVCLAPPPTFIATGWWRVSLIEGVGVLWLAYIRRILTCCTGSC